MWIDTHPLTTHEVLKALVNNELTRLKISVDPADLFKAIEKNIDAITEGLQKYSEFIISSFSINNGMAFVNLNLYISFQTDQICVIGADKERQQEILDVITKAKLASIPGAPTPKPVYFAKPTNITTKGIAPTPVNLFFSKKASSIQHSSIDVSNSLSQLQEFVPSSLPTVLSRITEASIEENIASSLTSADSIDLELYEYDEYDPDNKLTDGRLTRQSSVSTKTPTSGSDARDRSDSLQFDLEIDQPFKLTTNNVRKPYL